MLQRRGCSRRPFTYSRPFLSIEQTAMSETTQTVTVDEVKPVVAAETAIATAVASAVPDSLKAEVEALVKDAIKKAVESVVSELKAEAAKPVTAVVADVKVELEKVQKLGCGPSCTIS